VVVAVQRLLIGSRFYRLLRTLLRPTEATPEAVGPRVSVEDYVHNLKQFVELGAQHGARVVLLTRPHELGVTEQAAKPGWRATIPAYNRALADFARENGAAWVDVQSRFDGHPDLFVDECHFTQPGHQRMAELLVERLEPWLPPR
jgi:lysophospholipase L1-like esterase